MTNSKNRKIDYDRVDKIAYEFLSDYEITEFPIDINKLCKKLGINLIPYSAFVKKKELLLHLSDNGFSFINPYTRVGSIFINDMHPSSGSIIFTCLHEIFHLFGNDEFFADEQLADHFAQTVIAPPIILISNNIISTDEIVSNFGTSWETGGYILKKIINRILAMTSKILDYEMEYYELVYEHFK